MVGTNTTDPLAGSGTALATIQAAEGHEGRHLHLRRSTGDYAASDPDTLDSDSVLGRFVTLHVAQLAKG